MKEIRRIVRDVQPHWVGNGFPVRSLFSYNEGTDFDPFLLLDYGGPCDFPPSESRRGVEEHPHRGFETVTIVYQGELDHRDSSGSFGSIGPGDVQWMTAASGILHEEFHSDAFMKKGGTLEMVQLWVNLPAKDKMSRPHYQGITTSQIPQVPLAGNRGNVRVIAGAFSGVQGPAKTFTPINAWDLTLGDNGTFALPVPANHTSLLVVQSGSLKVNGTPVKSGELVLFERKPVTESANIGADSDSRILVLTGEPLGESVVGRGPFVMNTREEISQAIQDYQAGRMGQLT